MASSPEFSKKPGGPLSPQSVNEKPRCAHVTARESDILNDEIKKMDRNMKNLFLVLTIFITRKYITNHK
jgi:hypothetical protein